ncbi:carbonic anhydrase [Parasulfitobacter algicola]|uniref:Carbonic anhydrase n=1 Tax=Parasulfitobacter algicola TaxID=2614809 RepID=A0ABX2IZ89_9RHOB|nr:carbonic anhydrase [Sulfitobacter algicola]NSX55643.1 carbonic anhydrase [Sulfitobacter algicola]
MEQAKPLPGYLVQRYHGWKATAFADNEVWHKRMADEGQHPRVMVISCCDSRVHVTAIFGADQGEFFIHRNIANLVPPYAPDGDHHGTSAAVEYAVTKLNVAHIIVLGHSNCGGVASCDDMCCGKAPELEERHSFIGHWLDILRPDFDTVKHINDRAKRIKAMEKQAVVTSLRNLLSFPFVAGAVEQGHLSLHGLWTDIGDGGLQVYDSENGFVSL